MSKRNRSSNRNRPSIKYRFVSLEGESYELTNVSQPQDQLKSSRSSDSSSHEKSMSKAPTCTVSTTKLLTTVGDVWEHYFLPSIFQPEEKVHNGFKISTDSKGLKLTEKGCLASQLTSVGIRKTSYKSSQKSLLFDPSCGLVKNLSALTDNNYSVTNMCTTRAFWVFPELESIYERIFGSVLCERMDKNSCPYACQLNSKCTSGSLACKMVDSGFMNSGSASLPHDATAEDTHHNYESRTAEISKKTCYSLRSSYLLGVTDPVDYGMRLSKTLKFTLYSDYCIKSGSENSSVPTAESLPKNAENLEQISEIQCFTSENTSTTNRSCQIRGKFRDVFAKHRYAVSGALAGVFVSLCLHPFDTVKTILQSRALDQSAYRVAKSILSKRGVMGLYRGIATNIASSAPISGVYTYTYESVKSVLSPLLPREHYSFVHCVAGGCSSIATSFIFTPSERIKQQMQVRAQYSSCWNAFIGIFEKGGLISLYTGWYAVLCRNIPHSMIKFYTYEKLKKLMKFPAESIYDSDTLHTLTCGGLAGCTAAFFTTPFDVVKTKLQSQVPGSDLRYKGVLQVLSQVATEEGLRGLYRGLTPRLVMYVSQGALFFASYEFFKSVFSADVPIL